MASWGALSGLGAGLQQFGNEWSDRAKQKLADDLQKQREERAAERELAREKRQEAARLRQVDPRNTGLAVDPATGQMTRILRNSDYDTLRTEALSEYEADGLRRQEQADQAKLRAQGLEAQLKQLQVDRMPQKWAQEDAMHRARLGSESALQEQRRAAANFSNRRGLEDSSSETSGSVSREQYADALVKEYKATFDRAEVPDNERDGLAIMAVQRAAIDNTSPAQAMLELIREYRAGAPRQGAANSRRQGTLLGN